MSEQHKSLILTVGCITKSQKIIRISWKQDISKDLDFNERWENRIFNVDFELLCSLYFSTKY